MLPRGIRGEKRRESEKERRAQRTLLSYSIDVPRDETN